MIKYKNLEDTFLCQIKQCGGFDWIDFFGYDEDTKEFLKWKDICNIIEKVLNISYVK